MFTPFTLLRLKEATNKMEQEFMNCKEHLEWNKAGTSKLQLMDLYDDVIELILNNW